ncbi:poly-gamma-glutamate system protein [Natronincola ferrireducens]|uniref:Poly-gamma-glutamate system protein n=1 Tax=Natronincola ferrireducens TaxID=393762 RepID=A0A1G9FRA8_9FIRM|nr:poly-gamma-glutamate system protein [Natronincola ferrireducens]SDK90948.1 poly-gamma-glutamate system protein [Natronincola ferrireducens]
MKNRILFVLLVILLLGYTFLEYSKIKDKDLLYDKKVAASQHLERIFQQVKIYRLEIDGRIDTSIDINETGIVGPRYTYITTTLGSLESKRTTTNPHIAAMVVQMMVEAGLRKGDTVAVNASGSFPALNLAVIAAAEVLELDVLLISSIGSSTYGANDPRLTYLDMEQRLLEDGFINTSSIAYSYGGADDIGKDMDQKLLEEIGKRHQDKSFIYIKDYDENINERLKIYYTHDPNIALFINIGGNIVGLGKKDLGYGLENGYINPKLKLNYNDIGLAGNFLSRGIGVINLLDIKDLATEYGIQIDPIPIPNIAVEEIYFRYHYNRSIGILLLLIGGSGVLYYGHIHRCEIKKKLGYIKKQES